MSDIVSDDEFENAYATMNQYANEAIKEIYHRMPIGQQIHFSNGKTGTITKFFEPEDGSDRGCNDHLKDTWHFGIDVKFDDGSGHLEFIFYKGGWGMSCC